MRTRKCDLKLHGQSKWIKETKQVREMNAILKDGKQMKELACWRILNTKDLQRQVLRTGRPTHITQF